MIRLPGIFQSLLPNGTNNSSGGSGNGGISWWDTRPSAIASLTVGRIVNNGDQRSLAQYLTSQGSNTSTAVLARSPNVALGQNFFTDLTQTQQIAATIHEARHVQFQMGDTSLQGLLMNWGFKPNNSGSGAIADWIAQGCPK